jgi:hypothetical protein
MKDKLIIIVLLISFVSLLYGTDVELDSLSMKVNQLSIDVKEAYSVFNKEIMSLNSELRAVNEYSDSLRILINELEGKQSVTTNTLKHDISEQEKKTNERFGVFDGELGKRSIIVLTSLIILLLMIVIISLLLKKIIKHNKTTLEENIRSLQTELDEESIKLDNKLVEILEKQLKIASASLNVESNKEEDHSLALKVADEVMRIRMNLLNMDQNIRGHKQLSRAVSAIIDNFSAYGYDIPDLLNQTYDPGMKMIATMVQEDSLEPGTQLIKRIIKPQVNYKNKMIQAAEVVVAYRD